MLFGDSAALPWVDGAVYLGRDPEAPRLLVPATLTPDVPIALLERAVLRAKPHARTPAALLLDPLRLVGAAAPAPLELAALERWLAAGSP